MTKQDDTSNPAGAATPVPEARPLTPADMARALAARDPTRFKLVRGSRQGYVIGGVRAPADPKSKDETK
jgi:hypothetical protein